MSNIPGRLATLRMFLGCDIDGLDLRQWLIKALKYFPPEPRMNNRTITDALTAYYLNGDPVTDAERRQLERGRVGLYVAWRLYGKHLPD